MMSAHRSNRNRKLTGDARRRKLKGNARMTSDARRKSVKD
jgi:hypothetical protein